MPFSLNNIWPLIQKVKATCPVVHNITNFVVMNTTANALLAFGAAPIMAHEEEEIESIVSLSSSLVLNIGTLSKPWIRSMHKAIEAAKHHDIPIVIDPVGAGASSLRTNTATALANSAGVSFIRGNASEVMALAGVNGPSRGVDSAHSTSELATAKEAARAVAKLFSAYVCISGEVDIVTDGKTTLQIRGGSSLMPKVTGTGCTATALVGAVAGANKKAHPLALLCSAMAVMSTAGAMAEKASSGPGTFLPAFLDALFLMKKEDMEKNIIIES